MGELIAAAAGFASGMAASMGLGGGFVLMLYMSAAGADAGEMRAVNLIFFIPAALVSLMINGRNGTADTSLLPFAAAAGSVGAVTGLLMSASLDPALLKNIFAVLTCCVGARELLHKREGELKREC